MSTQPEMPIRAALRRHRRGELILVSSLAVLAIATASVALSVVTNERVAAAFSEPLTYARSFFDRNALATYAVPADGSNLISIEFDPATGAVIGPAGATGRTHP